MRFIYGHSFQSVDDCHTMYTVCGMFALTFTILNMISYKNGQDLADFKHDSVQMHLQMYTII